MAGKFQDKANKFNSKDMQNKLNSEVPVIIRDQDGGMVSVDNSFENDDGAASQKEWLYPRSKSKRNKNRKKPDQHHKSDTFNAVNGSNAISDTYKKRNNYRVNEVSNVSYGSKNVGGPNDANLHNRGCVDSLTSSVNKESKKCVTDVPASVASTCDTDILNKSVRNSSALSDSKNVKSERNTECCVDICNNINQPIKQKIIFEDEVLESNLDYPNSTSKSNVTDVSKATVTKRTNKHSGMVNQMSKSNVNRASGSVKSTSSKSDTTSKAHRLNRSVSDLRKQSSLFIRVESNLSSNIKKSYTRLQKVFAELHAALHAREADLKLQMDAISSQADQLMCERKTELKNHIMETQRFETLSVEEIENLRHDVKIFIGDRQLDEHLGSTAWFEYVQDNLNDIKKEINEFGCVLPVKTCYSKRRRSFSVSSTGSSLQMDTASSATTTSSPQTPIECSPSTSTSLNDANSLPETEEAHGKSVNKVNESVESENSLTRTPQPHNYNYHDSFRGSRHSGQRSYGRVNRGRGNRGFRGFNRRNNSDPPHPSSLSGRYPNDRNFRNGNQHHSVNEE